MEKGEEKEMTPHNQQIGGDSEISMENGEEKEMNPHNQQVGGDSEILHQHSLMFSSPIPVTALIRPPSKFCVARETNNRFGKQPHPY
jgi:hypothetical protein